MSTKNVTLHDENGNIILPATKTSRITDANGTNLDTLLQQAGQVKSISVNGVTQTIDANGNVNIASADGVGIASVVQTTTSSEDGGTNVVTVTKTDNTTSTFSVKNGSKGSKGDQGIQGERGLPGESGVTGDVSGFTVRQTIDPTATYTATDIAGAASLQATNAELTELAGIDISSLSTVSNYFINNSSKWANTTGSAFFYIPVTVGDKFKIVSNASTWCAYAILKNLTRSNGGTPNFATGETGIHKNLTEGAAGFIEITQSDAAYLYITKIHSSTDITPQAIYRVIQLKSIVEDNSTRIANVEESVKIISNIDLSLLPTLDCAISTSTNKWTAASSVTTQRHILVPVTVGKTYRMTGSSEHNYDGAFAWLTDNSISAGNAAPLVSGTSVMGTSSSVPTIEATAPTGAVYLYARTNWGTSTSYYPKLEVYISSGEAYNELNNKINTVDDSISSVESVEIDTSEYPTIQCAISSSTLKWTSNSTTSTQRHILIPVEEGGIYKLKKNDNFTYCQYAWLTSTSCTAGEDAPVVSGTSVYTLTNDTASYIIAPTGASYIYIRTNWETSTSYYPSYFGKEGSVVYRIGLLENAATQEGDTTSYKGYKYDVSGVVPNLSASGRSYDAKTVSITGIGTYSNHAQQSLAVHKGYMFSFYDAGYVQVIDFRNESSPLIIFSGIMTSDIANSNNHCGNANFSAYYYQDSDSFPLLYLSSYLENKCYVLRIVPTVGTDGEYTFSQASFVLAQTIQMVDDSSNVLTAYHFYPDEYGNILFHHPAVSPDTDVYSIFPLPSISTLGEAKTITYSSRTGGFRYSPSGYTAAGQVCRNHRLWGNYYKGSGTTNRYEKISVYNYLTKTWEADILLPIADLNSYEFEGLDIGDGKIYISYNGRNYIGLLEFDEEQLVSDKLDSVCGKGISRPSNAVVGQMFFDTTLGKPIWYDGSAWVDATGTAI